MRNTYATGIYTGKRHEKKDFRGAKAGVDVKKDIYNVRIGQSQRQDNIVENNILKKITLVAPLLYDKTTTGN